MKRVLVLFLICFAPLLRAGENEQYISAYNDLVKMTLDRYAIIQKPCSLVLKDAASSDPSLNSVHQSDLNAIRVYLYELMRNYYIAGDHVQKDEPEYADAFPNDPALIMGSDIGRDGEFTAVPGKYTVSGQTHYAEYVSSSIPLLWVHFKEINEVLKRVKYTLRGGVWISKGEASCYAGRCTDVHDESDEARACALAKWGPYADNSEDQSPTSYSSMRYWETQGMWVRGFSAALTARYAYLYIERKSERPCIATFYNYAEPARDIHLDFSPCGALVSNQRWTPWCAVAGKGPVITSEKLGNTAMPAWCSVPPKIVTSTRALGYRVSKPAAVMEWTDLYTTTVQNPELKDSRSDGIVDTGCDTCAAGKCLPGIDEEFDERFRDAYIKWPLGLSSGLAHGNIRVKAYIAERYVEGVPCQYFSLDTRVTQISEDPEGDWKFGQMIRPSGIPVVFAFKGDTGQPITPGGDYTLHQDDAGFELRFNDKKQTVHRFDLNGDLVQVRRTENSHELTLNGNPSSWPQLHVSRGEERVVSVSTLPMVALCQGQGALVQNVDYVDSSTGDTLRSLGNTPGSRIIREYDGAGNLIYEKRIYTTEASQEIWHDVVTNGVVSSARKTIRTKEEGPGEGQQTILHTEILHPGASDESEHVRATILKRYDWGSEVVAHINGYGTSAAQTNLYDYYDDPAATNSYGRLKLVEYAHGAWTRYDAYGPGGRPCRVVTPFGDASPSAAAESCRVTQHIYAGDSLLAALNFPADDIAAPRDQRPRLTIESVLGHEVSRTYNAYLPTGHITKRCATAGAAYDDAGALVTVSRVYTNGIFAGRLERIEHPDGRLSTYTYAYQSDPERLTTIQRSGAHDGVNVTNGTERITIVGPNNKPLATMTRDIASGLELTHLEYARDTFGRTLATTNRVTGTVTRNTMGCCGVETATDADGVVTTYTYGNLKQLDQTVRLGVTNRFVYDVQGNTVRRGVAADGKMYWTDTAYDAVGRVVAQTNALGAVTRHTYAKTDVGGEVVTTTYADGSTQIETRFRDGRIKSVCGTAAHPRAYAYGAHAEGSFTIEYAGADTNADEWVKTTTDLLGREQMIEYADGHTVSNRYDARGRQIARDDGITATLTAYDENSAPFRSAIDMNRNGVIDLAGPDRITESHHRVTTFEGHPVREAVSFVFAEDGSSEPLETRRMLTALDGSNSWVIAFGRTNHTQTVYDRENGRRIVTTTAPDGTSTVSAYEYGLLKSVRRLDVHGATMSEQANVYDALGRVITVTEAAANGETRTTFNQYDPLDQLTNVTITVGALRQVHSYCYDAMGRRTQSVLPDGGVVATVYNGRGEMVEQHGARIYPTRYTYTDQGRLATLSTYRDGMDGPADVTSWIYDSKRGWLLAKLYPDGEGEEYDYTPRGQISHKTLARDVVIEYAYDAAGDLKGITYSDDTPSVDYVRDRLGRAICITDDIGSRTNTYADLRRLVVTTQPQWPGAVLTYQYDRMARLTNTVLIVDGTPVHSTAYAFDAAGRIGAVEGMGVTATYQYGADGRTVTNLSFGAALSTGKRYYGLGRLKQIRSDISGGATRSFAYTYNRASQRTSATTEDGAVWTYAYDDLGQLISAQHHLADGTPMPTRMHTYEYDTIGNRKRVKRGVGSSAAESIYTVNQLNQYTRRTIPGRIAVTGVADPAARVTVQNDTGPTNTAARHGSYFWHTLKVDNSVSIVHSTNIMVNATLTQIENGQTNVITQTETRSATVPQTLEHFTHDLDGNLTSDANWHYIWNAENRLIGMSNATTTIGFTYDYMGRRCRKVVTSDVSSETNTYIYDGWNIIQETVESDVSSETNHYTHGLDIAEQSGSRPARHSSPGATAGGIGGLLAMTRDTGTATNTYLYVYDGNGNVVTLIDADDSTIAATYEYSPFGQLIRSTGPMASDNPVRWSTKHHDDETGLVMYLKRPYAPTFGRWLSRDGIRENGGLNLYSFVQNTPVLYIDPFGLALYAFDGTGTRYDTWTHISILHRSYGGGAWYEEGVGSRWYSKIFGGAFGLGGQGRVGRMYDRLVDTYEEDSTIDIIGFSRGAALARDFANEIYKKGIVQRDGTVIDCNPKIRFVGLFDTVGSFGWPGNDINIGVTMDLPANVERAAQAIAADERRAQFPFTPLNMPQDGQVFLHQVFRGDHSDIGGGHQENQNVLALQPLLFIWRQGREAGVPFGSITIEDGQDFEMYLSVKGERRPWPYIIDNTPHDLTDKLLYTDGGPRENLPTP